MIRNVDFPLVPHDRPTSIARATNRSGRGGSWPVSLACRVTGKPGSRWGNLNESKDGPLPAGCADRCRAGGRPSPKRRSALAKAGNRVDEPSNRLDRTDQQLNERPNPPPPMTLWLDFLGHLSSLLSETVPARLAGESGRSSPRGVGPIGCNPFLLKRYVRYLRASETKITAL